MKPNLKKLFLWSTVGGLAVGTAVALTRGSRRRGTRPLSCRKIPPGCTGIDLWTERYLFDDGGVTRAAHDRYHLQRTAFKVWSILDLENRAPLERPSAGGAEIFHITQTRTLEGSEDQEQIVERFYGIVSVAEGSGRPCGSSTLSRGGTLEVRKCYVGGAANGVESGEIHLSRAPVLNYRFEYAAS